MSTLNLTTEDRRALLVEGLRWNTIGELALYSRLHQPLEETL